MFPPFPTNVTLFTLWVRGVGTILNWTEIDGSELSTTLLKI